MSNLFNLLDQGIEKHLKDSFNLCIQTYLEQEKSY